MSSTNTWTKEDLNIYLLIYCANADSMETKSEIDFIKAKVKSSDFDQLHQEFENDNDYQSIQKIRASIEHHGFDKSETETLFSEIKTLFLSDGKYDVLEKNLFRGLSHILI